MYLYCYISLTDFNQSHETKLNASYGLLAITALYIATNLGFFFYMILKYLIRYLRKKIGLYRQR